MSSGEKCHFFKYARYFCQSGHRQSVEEVLVYDFVVFYIVAIMRKLVEFYMCSYGKYHELLVEHKLKSINLGFSLK